MALLLSGVGRVLLLGGIGAVGLLAAGSVLLLGLLPVLLAVRLLGPGAVRLLPVLGGVVALLLSGVGRRLSRRVLCRVAGRGEGLLGAGHRGELLTVGGLLRSARGAGHQGGVVEGLQRREADQAEDRTLGDRPEQVAQADAEVDVDEPADQRDGAEEQADAGEDHGRQHDRGGRRAGPLARQHQGHRRSDQDRGAHTEEVRGADAAHGRRERPLPPAREDDEADQAREHGGSHSRQQDPCPGQAQAFE
ncbi:hypothetical protein FHS13_000707 [Nocardiopsis algeriensis]|uniref:Uncharacterized protein n=1 Tax=Nocardiopsis algeriensis TaxID=1478215 RepID=A0A841IQ39_9ACTN|nr:hypothetical protein [Nocardiopsis algeriensis]